MNPSSPENAGQTSRFWHVVREWVQTIVIALAIALPIRYFIAEPFIVQGASMDPTFASGQFLIVDRLSYRFEEPQRGDVVIFEYPNDPSLFYIKRIIGLPGETIKINDGIVTIVNKENPKGFQLKDQYVDPDHASHDSEEATLSTTQYFVMGDNRSQSSDSRKWGALEKNFIVGRPIFRLLPVNTISVFPGEQRQ